MSAIEAEIEAVARELCEADGGTSRGAAHAWKAYRSLARGAIRALAPLIIERCAEVATPKYDAPCGCTSCCCGKLDDAENQAAWREATHISARIRALNHFGDATEMVSTVTSRTVPIPEDDVVAAYRGLMVLATMCRKAGLAAGYETAVDIEKRLQKAYPALIGLAVLRSGDGHALIQEADHA